MENRQSYWWLKFGDIQGETASTIVTEHQAISKTYFKNNILKEEIYSKCWLCKQHEELLTTQPQDVPFWQRINTYRDTTELVHIYIIWYAKHWASKKTKKWYKNTPPSQYVKKKMWQCYGIKEYTQTEKLRPTGQI